MTATCGWCDGKGWAVVNDGGEYDGQVQRCDACRTVANDIEAEAAARAAGVSFQPHPSDIPGGSP